MLTWRRCQSHDLARNQVQRWEGCSIATIPLCSWNGLALFSRDWTHSLLHCYDVDRLVVTVTSSRCGRIENWEFLCICICICICLHHAGNVQYCSKNMAKLFWISVQYSLTENYTFWGVKYIIVISGLHPDPDPDLHLLLPWRSFVLWHVADTVLY